MKIYIILQTQLFKISVIFLPLVMKGLSVYLNFSERRKSELIMLYWERVMRSKSNIGFAFDTERHQQHLKCSQTLFPLFHKGF